MGFYVRVVWDNLSGEALAVEEYRSRKQRLTALGTRYADHVTPLYPQKLALTSPTGGGRSVGIVRVRTKATELLLLLEELYLSVKIIIRIL